MIDNEELKHDGGVGDTDECTIELVLATRENTKNVGWFVSDDKNSIEKECDIPFYKTVKEGATFADADWKDQAVVRQARIRWGDDTTVSWMERHMEMTQGFFLVGTSPALLVLGEPTHDREDLTEDERNWPDWGRTRGYIVPPGCGIIIKKGTWHDFPVSVGPDVTVFVLNTREVIDALSSMKEAAPMDFGDCYKVRIADGGRTVRFPDPRPFVASLGFMSGVEARSERSTSITSCSSEGGSSGAASESVPELGSDYGHGMRRAEAGEWGGPHADHVWVVPVINVESFDSNTFGPSVQPHLNTTQPELANRGWREYGNKQGLKRLGRIFGQHDIPCTAVVSSDLVDDKEVLALLRQFKDDDRWEIGAHGLNNSNAGHADMTETEEAGTISRSLERLGAAFQDDEPKTWLTPGFSVTNSTPKLLSEAGVETLLDFVDDDVPFRLEREDSGSSAERRPLVCLPYSMETNDFSLVLTRHLSPREYAAALESHVLQLARESRESGTPRVVCLGMHTFVAGAPAAAYELDKMLGRIESYGNIRWATAREVTERVRNGDPEKPLLQHHGTTPSAEGNTVRITVKPSTAIEVDRGKLALLLVDFQNDFLCRGGFGERLGNDPSKLRRIVRPTRDVLDAARALGVAVVHTREGHRSNLADLTSLKAGDGAVVGREGRGGRPLVRGEWGNDIVPELTPLPDETVIDKPGKGAFYQTDLELVLRNANVDTLVVCGATTEVCVHSTVREANDRGITCVVLEDCTASYFEEFHRVGLEMISAQGGILGKVSDSRSVIDGLNRIRR